MTARTKALAKNMEFIGYSDLNKKSGFQMSMQKTEDGRYFIYAACFRDNGFNIIDVTDPTNPKATWMDGPWISEARDGQSVPKVQVADGLMVASLGPVTEILHGCPPGNPFYSGFAIWDVKTDPEHPKLLSITETPFGGHRSFYNGGKYAYIICGKEGYFGYALRIYDISDPVHPVEVGSYVDEKQNLMNLPKPEEIELADKEMLSMPMAHACTVKDNICYLAYPNHGVQLLDVSDPTNIKELGCLKLNPPFGGGAAGARVHTAMPLGDTPYMLVTTEGERARFFANETEHGLFKKLITQPMNMIGIAEVTDPGSPSLISVFPYPEVPEGYTHGENFNIVDGVRIPFGSHNMFDAFGIDCYEKFNNRVYNCYFNAGLRVYDVSDPFVPKEIAYFMPPDPQGENWFDNERGNLFPGPKVAIAEDVLVDDRGYIYFDALQDGLYIVRCTV